MKRLTLLALALLASAPAVGRADTRAPLVDSLQGPAKGAYESAKLLLGNHDFAGARAKFQEAYDASREPRLLFNIAACEKELHHYARMQAMLQRFERESAGVIAPDEKARADAALAAIASLVGSVRLTVDQADATVTFDGEAVGTTPLAAAVPTDLGRHVVVVEKAGYELATQTIEVNGGAALAVAVELVPSLRGAHLVIIASDDAAIALDGHPIATGRLDAAVRPGPHSVHVTANGKIDHDAEVDLRDGETRTIDVTLAPRSHAAIWPWAVGGAAVVVAGAAVGAYFLLRPQQDHLTAPPDGTFGTAKFSAIRF